MSSYKSVMGVATMLLLHSSALSQLAEPGPDGSSVHTKLPAIGDNTEGSSHRDEAVFKGSLNLVLVPVVVRNFEGHAVMRLKADNFELFDKGKRQIIKTFIAQKEAPEVDRGGSADAAQASGSSNQSVEKYLAFIFDDLHTPASDLVRARDAAFRFLDSSPLTGERIAVFTTSGQTTVDFTSDLRQLREALHHLQSRPISWGQISCPALSDYEADLIVNGQNKQALDAAVHEISYCTNLGPEQKSLATRRAMEAAARRLDAADTGARLFFQGLNGASRRLAKLPGKREIVLVSPGFFVTKDARVEQMEAIDRVVRAGIAINVLDAGGLAAPGVGGDISKPSYDVVTVTAATQYGRESAAANAGVLAEVADSTGGIVAHNSNDLDSGIKMLAGSGQSAYILGFSPQDLRLDGGFHSLRVKVTPQKGLSVRARPGYYAVPVPEPGEIAERDLENALFFRREARDFPIEIQTRVEKNNESAFKVQVLLHVGLGPMRLKTTNGSGRDDVTVVVGLFDGKIKYLSAKKQVVQIVLPEANLSSATAAGLNLTESFDIQLGSYSIRAVAQDGEGGLLSAATTEVDLSGYR